MRLFSIFLLFCPAFCSYLPAQSDNISSSVDERPMDKWGFYVSIGDTIPNIEFQLDDGSTTSLQALRGKIVLLQFTASWCGVCREEMPYIESELWQKYKDKGLMVIGVDYDEPMSKVRKFKKQIKTTYPLALDPGAEIFCQFAGRFSGVTRNVVLDENGTVIYLSRWFKLEEFREMVRFIENELISMNDGVR